MSWCSTCACVDEKAGRKKTVVRIDFHIYIYLDGSLPMWFLRTALLQDEKPHTKLTLEIGEGRFLHTHILACVYLFPPVPIARPSLPPGEPPNVPNDERHCR